MTYYCLGIKGAGMSTLACILYDLGNDVVGYDDTKDYKFTEDGLRERNIPIFNDDSFTPDSNTIVTYSVALNEQHKEIQRLKNLETKIVKYNEILGEITKMFQTICVSGTHGKTTTTTLIKSILESVMDVNYFIGDGNGFAIQDNSTFVIESDEFNRHFLAYDPTYTVITNIELEHTEIYKDIDDIINTFELFANKTKDTIVACGDNENIRKIKFNKKVIFYGFDDNNDITAKNVILDENGSHFDMYINGTLFGHFSVPLFGKHMVLNALAAITICKLKGLTYEVINESLLKFKNAKRRFAIEEINGITIIDDYAHHPTELKVTLEAARQKYPNKELIAVFKPNTYSRTQRFYNEFANVLNIADKSYITEIDCNRENPNDYGNVTSKVILDLLNNGDMIDEQTVDKLLKHDNAVVCFMSCASIAHLKEAYINCLNNK